MRRGGSWLLAVAYLGFMSLGLPDPVAGVAWPSVRETFGLHQSSFGLIFLALGCGYCSSGFFGGKLTHALGLGNLLWISSGLVAAAMFADAAAPRWALMIFAAVMWGLGSGGIDAGLNAYAAKHFSPGHMNWLHACYSLGATFGPLVMTATLVRLGSWRSGYAAVGVVLAAMAALFLVTRRSWDDPIPTTDAPQSPPTSLRAALRNRLVQLQIVLFFLYVGLEFTVGQWCFTLLTESRGASADVAGSLAAAYYAAIGVGRVVFGAFAARIGIDRLLRMVMFTALVGGVLYSVAGSMLLDAAALLVIGISLAPVFPCLMSRTPERVGTAVAAHAVGFQVSAGMLGAAVVPSLAGLCAESFGLEAVAVVAAILAGALFAAHELLLRLNVGNYA
jgi:fucose permease